MLTHLDLFSGIGGFALACQWNGIETIGFVEIDKYCQKVLKKHWPNVPIVEDIRDVEQIKGLVTNTIPSLCRRGPTVTPSRENQIGKLHTSETKQTTHDIRGETIGCDVSGGVGIIEQRTPNVNESPAILVTAGFPCQPFSVAGKQLSHADDRYLWPQTIAVIKEVRSKWVLLENVTGIINLALDTVLSDLEGAGYTYETLVIPACAVNAPHRRDRIWVMGYPTGIGFGTGSHNQRGRHLLDSPFGSPKTGQQTRDGRQLWVGEGSPSQGILPNSEQSISWRGGFAGRGDGQGGQRPPTEPTSLQPKDRARHSGDVEQGCPVMAVAPGWKPWQSPEPKGREDTCRRSEEVANVADSTKCDVGGTTVSGRGMPCTAETKGPSRGGNGQGNGVWSVEPKLGRMVDGLPGIVDGYWDREPDIPRIAMGIDNRKERLSCLGNAIVPQVAYEIIRAIVEIDERIPQ